MRVFGWRFLIILLLGSVVVGSSNAGVDERKRENAPAAPFGRTEQLIYEGEFSKAVLRGVDIAEIRFSAERRDQTTEAPAVINYKAEVVSKGMLLKLFGVSFRQLVESRIDPKSQSLLSNTKLDEQGNRRRSSETIVDSEKSKLTWIERDPNDPKREPRVVTSEFEGTVQDLASVIYYLRTQPLQPGRSFEITVSDSGRVYRMPVNVVERKHMHTVLGNVTAVRVVPEVFGDGRLINGKGSVSVWLTDDKKHIPVKARINSELGTLDIKLKTASTSGSRP